MRTRRACGGSGILGLCQFAIGGLNSVRFFFYFIFFYFSVAVRSASALDSTIRGVVGRRFHKRVLVLTGFYFIFFFLIGLEGI